jgi:hypothetical protein
MSEHEDASQVLTGETLLSVVIARMVSDPLVSVSGDGFKDLVESKEERSSASAPFPKYLDIADPIQTSLSN